MWLVLASFHPAGGGFASRPARCWLLLPSKTAATATITTLNGTASHFCTERTDVAADRRPAIVPLQTEHIPEQKHLSLFQRWHGQEVFLSR